MGQGDKVLGRKYSEICILGTVGWIVGGGRVGRQESAFKQTSKDDIANGIPM